MKEWNDDKELVSLIKGELYTAVVGDIMDKMGYTHQFLPPHIRPLRDDMFVAGRAMTVLEADVYDNQGTSGTNPVLKRSFGLMLEALDDLNEGEIYICSGSSPSYALWGELMSARAMQCKAAGAVVNGYSRDTKGILALNFPCFSYGPYAQDQAPRGKVIDYRVPIEIEGVLVNDGDMLVGDIDGVCVVTRQIDEEVFTRALEKARGERIVLKKIQEGMKARDAFDKFGIMLYIKQEKMKITDVKVWLVQGIKYNWTLLKIYTDEGYTGVGEATNWPGSPIVYEAAKHIGSRIIGLDPMKTDFIWTKLYRDLNWVGPYGASMCAISGIDMALLDLKGKVLGVPCYELLGGAYRKDILLYANYWFTKGGHNEADYAEQARAVKAAGFTGLKFDPFAHTNYFYGEDLASNLTLTPAQQDLAFNVSKAVREAVGPEVDIMIETHAMLNYRIAVKMAERLATLDIAWYEEPAGPESSQTLRAMRERIPSDVAICVGERHYTRFGIRSLLEKHVCDIIMPDITRCGGPSEMKRMATMAEAYQVLLAPHNPNGPLSTLASSHVCASVPNFFRQEFMFNDVPWRDTVIDHPIADMVYDGHLHLSDRPGLGVDLVEEEMEKHPGITSNPPENFYI